MTGLLAIFRVFLSYIALKLFSGATKKINTAIRLAFSSLDIPKSESHQHRACRMPCHVRRLFQGSSQGFIELMIVSPHFRPSAEGWGKPCLTQVLPDEMLRQDDKTAIKKG